MAIYHRRQLIKRSLQATMLCALIEPGIARADELRYGTKRQQAMHAMNRLGYGPTLAELSKVEIDPRAWIQEQLAISHVAQASAHDSFFASMDLIETVRTYVQKVQQNNAKELEAGEFARYLGQYTVAAAEARLFRALSSPRQLEEVMVEFWFNHFNVFQAKNLLRVMVGHYEHHAIRPHAIGRFADLLKATAHHPAMLFYLDNVQSSASRGLNENYARELMELHTLGVDGGYTQNDVTELARMLTGWTMEPVNRLQARQAQGAATALELGKYGFMYNDRIHVRGEKTWLGKQVAYAGKREGDEALDALAIHPSTAKHLAFKLAQYFVSDNPSDRLVQRLAKTFLDTRGEIRAVLSSLFDSDEFWQERIVRAKYKTPYHYLLSALRLTGQTPRDVRSMLGSLANQGMPLFLCVTPDGYKNTEQSWLNSDAMSRRLNAAARIAVGRLGDGFLSQGHSIQELTSAMGTLLGDTTRQVIAEQKDPILAMTFLLASPEMMRR